MLQVTRRRVAALHPERVASYKKKGGSVASRACRNLQEEGWQRCIKSVLEVTRRRVAALHQERVAQVTRRTVAVLHQECVASCKKKGSSVASRACCKAQEERQQGCIKSVLQVTALHQERLGSHMKNGRRVGSYKKKNADDRT